MKRVFMGVLAVCLSGCIGPLVPVVPVDEQSVATLEKTTPVFEPGAAPRGATLLGPIEAVSCKNKIWDPEPTRENAAAQLRQYARQRGGNAVGDLTCGPIEPTNLLKNCWSAITCTATALKIPEGVQR